MRDNFSRQPFLTCLVQSSQSVNQTERNQLTFAVTRTEASEYKGDADSHIRNYTHTSYLSQTQQAGTTGGACGENSATWRNFRLNAEIVPFKCGENLSYGEILHMRILRTNLSIGK